MDLILKIGVAFVVAIVLVGVAYLGVIYLALSRDNPNREP